MLFLDPKNKLSELEAYFGLHFRDFSLLERAMTHSSFANEHGTFSNERLEFLGDAVLDLAVGRYLYDHLPYLKTQRSADSGCKMNESFLQLFLL